MFFMLLAQQGAVIHALSHWQEDLQSAEQHERKPAPESHQAPEHACMTCLAFAMIGTALPSAGLALAAPQHFTFAPTPQTNCLEQRFLALYDSRAPPVIPV